MSEGMDREALEKTMKALLANQEVLEMAMKPIAQLTKVKLDSLVNAGFSRQEAMEIIKARGLEA